MQVEKMDTRHSVPVAENLLDQKFEASAPNRIWLTETNEIRKKRAGCLVAMAEYAELIALPIPRIHGLLGSFPETEGHRFENFLEVGG